MADFGNSTKVNISDMAASAGAPVNNPNTKPGWGIPDPDPKKNSKKKNGVPRRTGSGKVREAQRLQNYVDKEINGDGIQHARHDRFELKHGRNQAKLESIRNGTTRPPPGAGPNWLKKSEKKLVHEARKTKRRNKRHEKHLRMAKDIVANARNAALGADEAEANDEDMDDEQEDEYNQGRLRRASPDYGNETRPEHGYFF